MNSLIRKCTLVYQYSFPIYVWHMWIVAIYNILTFRKIAADRTMEMAVNGISDLAKTIADVGTADEELCRLEHMH